MTGWRRAFCTSIPKDKETTTHNQSPRISSKFGFFSNPSTPRSQNQNQAAAELSLGLRCRTSVATAISSSSSSSTPNSPKQKKTNPSKLFHFSNPSSPKSPSSFSSSSFSFIKSTLRFSKSRCGICLQSVKKGQGTAIFTSECSHSFHFPCISSHLNKNHTLSCPICSSLWNEPPFLDNLNPKKILPIKLNDLKSKQLKVYDDDEPLMSPTSGSRFNPIPELNENEDEEDDDNTVEFQGFFPKSSPLTLPSPKLAVKSLEVSLLPEAAVVAVGRSYETYAVVLKIKAPATAHSESMLMNRNLRPSIDLVTVLDVSPSMNSIKLQMVKRTMRLIISSLHCSDRLSIVAFSGSSKRLFALRKMSSNGRRSARRIVDLLCEVSQGQGVSVHDAIKKSAKVLEDRRERNSVATIILLSDSHDDRLGIVGAPLSGNQNRFPPVVCSTRFPHLEIPVHAVSFADAPSEDALAKCINGLLTVVVQDLRLQLGFSTGSSPAEIAAVYSLSDRPAVIEPGSVRVGDLSSEEVREFLIELKVPASSIGSHHLLTVRSTYRDTSSQGISCSKQQVLAIPRPRAVRSSGSNLERLRNLHVTIRAVAESQRLIEHGDFSAANHLLSSARALLIKQSGSSSANEYIKGLEAELATLSRRKHSQQRQNVNGREASRVDEKMEALTPTSAWRAAERLAKVAIMRKSMNRVSDLHGFEDARF